MSKVKVKWLKSPRHKYRIPRAAGTFSLVDEALAERILEESPDFLVIVGSLKKEKPPVVKDAMARKPRTRPVKREKDS